MKLNKKIILNKYKDNVMIYDPCEPNPIRVGYG